MRPKSLCVLILHNIPRPAKDGGAAWAESDAGVLDQVKAVATALDKLGMPHRTVGVQSLTDLPAVLSASPEEVVFNLVESLGGDPGDALLVPATIRSFGKACTGSDTPCLALATDKWMTKGVLARRDLRCPGGAYVPVGQKVPRSQLPPPPYIVKPVLSDASEGIDAYSVVRKAGAALEAAVARVHRYCQQAAIVEQFVDGRELNVSVLQRGDSVEVLPLAEIDFTNFGERPRIVGYTAKWIEGSFEFNNTNRIIPAVLPRAVAEEALRLALAAWHAVGCRDYARVDFRLDAKNRPYILEVNPNPDISPLAGFPAALKAAHISYAQFVRALVKNAFARLPLRPQPSHIRHSLESSVRRKIRRSRASDRNAVLDFIRDTGNFRPNEIDVAEEVLDSAIAEGARGDYQSYVVVEQGRPVGWVCFGATPCTEGTFDVYWLVVSPTCHRSGYGSALMTWAEEHIHRAGGRLSVVETSSRPDYEKARSFYLKFGYHEGARARNFYAPGDDKIIYLKDLNGA